MGGVAVWRVDSKSGPRARAMASSIVPQGLVGLLSLSELVEGGGRVVLLADVEVEVDVEAAVVGGERMTEARRRGWRGLLLLLCREVEVEVSAAWGRWRLAPHVPASPGTWIGGSRGSSEPSFDCSCLGLAFILDSSGKFSAHEVELSPNPLPEPDSGFGVFDELERLPLPNMSDVG